MRAALTAAVLLGALALASPAFAAADAEGHGPDWFLLGLQILNTAILVFILVRFARRPLRDFLVQRSRGIRQDIERGEEQLREASEQLESLRQRLDAFDRESAELVADAEQRALAERTLVMQRAERIAERLRGEAERVADREVERARRALRDEAAELAVSVAGELVRDEIRPEDDERLVREYTQHVGRNGGSE